MKQPGYLLTSKTREWVPRLPAKSEANVIYSEFSHNLGCAEDLSHLALVAASGFDVDIVKRFLSDERQERLTSRGYLERQLGDLANRITLRTTIAINMVRSDVDEGTVSGYLVEPFHDKEILSELYQIYLVNRRRHQDPSLNHSFPS